MIKIDLWRVLKSCRNIKSIFTCWSRRNIARLGKTGQPCNVLIIYSESRSLRVFYTTVTIGLYIIYILDIRTAIYYRRAQDWLGSGWGCVKQDITKTRQWFTRGLCVSIPLRSTTVGRSQHLRITNIRKCPLRIAGGYIYYIMPMNTRSGLSCDNMRLRLLSITCTTLVHIIIWTLTIKRNRGVRPPKQQCCSSCDVWRSKPRESDRTRAFRMGGQGNDDVGIQCVFQVPKSKSQV